MRNSGIVLTPPSSALPPTDYVIAEADRLGEGGPKTKFRDNMAALRTLQRLQEARAAGASPEDQRILVRYVGWGGLPQAFDLANPGWKAEAEELRLFLDPHEYAQARRSTQDAHYTSQEVVQGIYQGLERLGFRGPARILEPSAGIGHFRGLQPEYLRQEEQEFHAVEVDPLTADIGGYLYPNVKYVDRGFQDFTSKPNYFDLAVGNVPFGSQKIYDRNRPDLDFSIHNYFLAKSIDSLRPGGLAAFVVSRYFLDAANNPAREFIAARADFLGAIRLPNTAFKKNALTEVTTDIVFFQRRGPEQEYYEEPENSWLQTGQMENLRDSEGRPLTINRYFLENPGQMIGRMALTHGMFQESPELLPPEDFAGFAPEIARRLEALPRDVYRPRAGLVLRSAREEAADPNWALCARLQPGSFFFAHGHENFDGRTVIGRRLEDDAGRPDYEIYQPKNKMEVKRLVGMIQLLETQDRLMAAEEAGDPVADRLRGDLNQRYDDFIKHCGYLNSPGNHRVFREDPGYPRLAALEREYDPGLSKEAAAREGREPRAARAVKSDIFFQRVLGERRKIERVETPKEALIVSMNEYGRPDLDFMSGLCGRSVDDLIGELTGLIYLNPQDRNWELADHYLTGDVRGKLGQAEAAAKKDARFRVNVEALRAVQPPDLDPVDISVNLGSTWVPAGDVAAFARHLLGPGAVEEVGYHPALDKWAVEFDAREIDLTTATSTWGTPRYPAHRLFLAVLNNEPVRVMDEAGLDPATGRPKYKLNESETAAAQAKADEMRQSFQDWIWRDQDRREALARLYNDRFNTHIPRKYDGSHLELPGSSLAITLRPHQKDAIWRGIQDQTALFDHVVGSGKTLTVIGTIMESRRMGLMKKPMVVVPNHLLTQWKDTFYSLYPQANILAAGKEDFEKSKREKLFARVATGDWDAVIVPHSSFKKIDMPEETKERFINEQVDDLTAAIAAAKAEGGGRVLVKEMEKTRDKLLVMMTKKAEGGIRDKAVTFADLGCDALFVDESQEFKNLFITTKMRNVAGLGDVAGSAKAFDLFIKARYIQERNQGRGVFFATGTPISNTIAEMFTVQRYLQYDTLKEKGLAHFDAWASTFGQVVQGWELDATGVGYKLNSRFAKFQNMPELVNLYRSFGDVVNQGDVAARNRNLTPKVKGGKPLNLVAERSGLQAAYMDAIIHRMENMPKNPRLDNPLKVTNDARKAGLDYRLIDPAAPDFEGSKINVAAGEIFRLWQQWEADRGTQLVFCDLSTPKGAAGAGAAGAGIAGAVAPPPASLEGEPEETLSMDEILAAGVGARFSVYDDLKAKLIAKGLPEGQIKFIHEAKTDLQKAKLFEAVNRGEVRVLIGSTSKMGAGMNVQKRLTCLHHLDAPWRPSDLEQREGRIIRQGNMFHERDPENFEVEIIRYATKRTYDARMFQTIQAKAEGIEQFRKGDSLVRVMEDVAGEAANAAEMKAAATGNDLIFTQVKLAAELKKTERLQAVFLRNRHSLERRVKDLTEHPSFVAKEVKRYREEIALRDENTLKSFAVACQGRIYDEKTRKDLVPELVLAMKKAVQQPDRSIKLGLYRGFGLQVEAYSYQGCQFVLDGRHGLYRPQNLTYRPGDNFSVGGLFQRIDNSLAEFEKHIERLEASLPRKAAELAEARRGLAAEFPQAALLEALRQDNRDVLVELKKAQGDPAYQSSWTPASRNSPARPEPTRTEAQAPDTPKELGR